MASILTTSSTSSNSFQMTCLGHYATHTYDTDTTASRRIIPTTCLPRRTSKMLKQRYALILQPHALTHHPSRNQTHPHHSISLTTAQTALPHLRRAPRRRLQVLPTRPHLPLQQRRLQIEENDQVRRHHHAPSAAAEAQCRRDGERREAGRNTR